MRQWVNRGTASAIATLGALLLFPAGIRAQGHDTGVPLKRAHAGRVDNGAVDVDGRLSEAVWAAATFITDFRQKEPVEFGEPSERTEVAFAYDGEALYVGARLLHRDPTQIPRALSRRDQYGNAEHLVISLDPYLDRRTAYSFSVTASGVRRDYYHPRDREDFGGRDFTFDPVWEAKAQIDSTGWTAEMRIPFSQLRFTDKPVQEWGINVLRWIPTRNEDIDWVVVPRNETGYASRFGLLTGIEGIHPSRRIEISPYVATSGTFAGTPDPDDPFDPDGRSLTGRVGADLKMGLGPNLTLDATINPDFGQVEADPAEVNLTAFETFFDERRPFFTEGSQLLRSNVADYFYSRRIGGRPHTPLEGDYLDQPAFTTILGAAKLSGQLKGGLSIAGLAALTQRESGRVHDIATDATREAVVEPRTAYGVARVQQQFGRDASTVGAVVSGMNRWFAGDSTLRSSITSRAVAGGVDWVLRFRRGEYELSGDVGGSYVRGSREAILSLQQASSRYLQRPDFGYMSVDSARTSLSGYRGRIRLDKNAGNWLFGAEASLQSPGFETNDMGRIQTVDDIDTNADVNYRWTQPTDLFRNARLGVFHRSSWNFDGVRTNTLLGIFSRFTWLNFMSSSFNLNVRPRSQSDNLTRGGPLMPVPAGMEANASLNSSFASPTQWNLSLNHYRDELGGRQWRFRTGLTVRPNSALSVSINPSYLRVIDAQQYITTLENGPAATFGSRYVFGRIERSTLSAQLRVNYTFAPDLSLEVYAEPFAASGKYSQIGELASPRSSDRTVYGEGPTTVVESPEGLTVTDSRNGETFFIDGPDFNALSFRSNMVLRWEWRPGSTLFLVWQQSRSAFCSPADPLACPGVEHPGSLVGIGSLRDSLRSTGDNFLAIKATYWIGLH